MKRHRKKWAVGAAALVIASLAAVGAYAYFTAGGSGTGTASVGTVTNIELSGSTTGTLYPEGPAGDVAITVHNPGSGSQYVDKVQLAGVDPSDASCDATAFSMPEVTVGQTIAAGGSVVVHGALSMADNGSNQNDCQGNSLTLNLTSN